jgi:hypothetical protein
MNPQEQPAPAGDADDDDAVIAWLEAQMIAQRQTLERLEAETLRDRERRQAAAHRPR